MSTRRTFRPRTFRHRPSRIVPAAICATVLIAAGIALVLAAVAGQTSAATVAPDVVVQWLSGLSWFGTVMVIASSVVVLLGLVLLLAGLIPGRPNALDLADPGPAQDGAAQPESPWPADTEMVITRRALSRLVLDRAGQVDGVDRVWARTTPRLVRVTAQTPTRYTDEVAAGIRRTVIEALQDSGLRRAPKVRVAVVRRGSD